MPGPILGLILSGRRARRPPASSALLLVAFAAGAASALGARAARRRTRAASILKRSLGAEVWIRRGLGVAVLVGVAGIALGWDTGILARMSLTPFGTATSLEQRLVDRVRPQADAPAMAMRSGARCTAAVARR